MALLAHGGLAEFAVAPEAETFAIPEHMSFEDAGAFPVAYISSHVALRWQGRLEPGETLLVLGAAGGVGLTAVEIGKAMGARVIAATTPPQKRAVARERGADDVVNYSTEKLTARVMAPHRRQGRRRVLRSRGRRLFRRRLVVARWGGRILLIGFVAGVPQIPANRLLVSIAPRSASSLRYFRWHAPDKLRRSVEDSCQWYGEGKLRPLVTHRLPLEQSVEAIRLLTDRKAHGKVVVTMEPR
jgi:NADPH2:quinone reductase